MNYLVNKNVEWVEYFDISECYFANLEGIKDFYIEHEGVVKEYCDSRNVLVVDTHGKCIIVGIDKLKIKEEI